MLEVEASKRFLHFGQISVNFKFLFRLFVRTLILYIHPLAPGYSSETPKRFRAASLGGLTSVING